MKKKPAKPTGKLTRYQAIEEFYQDPCKPQTSANKVKVVFYSSKTKVPASFKAGMDDLKQGRIAPLDKTMKAKPKAPKLDPGPYWIIGGGPLGLYQLYTLDKTKSGSQRKLLMLSGISSHGMKSYGYTFVQVKLVPLGRGKK